jgi:4-hydroxy-4-methyl-2-oxoglutarate aldolase
VKGVSAAFASLSTPLVADSCLRCGVPLRAAPPGLRPVVPGHRLAGRVLPARHYGSVDVFLEAFGAAEHGDVLVVDDGGRTDESCVGDLTALEAMAVGIAGLVVWGLHRDTHELREIRAPVYSYGAYPGGPTRLDERDADALTSARFGPDVVTADDIVFADDDGALFVPAASVDEVVEIAGSIGHTEREQARKIGHGETLRRRTDFDEYLARRAADPTYSFRQHLRGIGGEIEE